MDDGTIILQLIDGDAEVIAMVRSWIQSSFGPYRTRLSYDLEDLEQDILLSLTQNLIDGRFRGDSSLRTYVRQSVHHQCIDRVRALTRRQWVDIEDLDLPSEERSALDTLSARETTELALRISSGMPAACRELWAMIQRGMRYQDMSSQLGVSENTLRVRVLRCRKKALEERERISKS